MKINEFRLRLYPKDYYAERAFFLNIMKFSIVHEWDREDSKGVMFDVNGTTLELLYPAESGFKDMATGSGLSLCVDYSRQLFSELQKVVNITHKPVKRPWGDISFGITTPNGYQISFFTKTKEYED